MPESDFTARWQIWYDRVFPRGAVAAWDEAGNTATYLIPRVLVTGQRGLDPEITLPVFAGPDKVLGPFRVLSSQHRLRGVRLVLDSVEYPLLLSAAVSPEAARAMGADRERFVQEHP